MYISKLFLLILCLVVPAVSLAQDPLWAVISTEDDHNDPSPTFFDQQALQLFPPDFVWSNNPADVFFDPQADVFGFDPGLDAYHYELGTMVSVPQNIHYFSTEVGFTYNSTLYNDEEVLVYDTATGLLTKLFNVALIAEIGVDVGLDAISPAISGCDCSPIEGWAFSSEVDGNLFDDGDILITDGTFLTEVIDMEQVFGANVGLDAIHMAYYEYTAEGLYRSFAISTEVDGILGEGDGAIAFTDQDIIIVDFINATYTGNAQLVWSGEEAFGQDVGLDALYLEVVPEPSIMALAFIGLGIITRKLRKK